MGRPVEEVWVAECDVARSEPHELRHVLEYHLGLDDAEPPVVHDRNGAVSAPVSATVACLDIPGETHLPVDRQSGVPIEWR